MIEVRNLTRYYGSFSALQDVTFRVGEGQIVGLLGKNGAGKTTALRILGGLLLPSAGTVTVDGIDIVEQPERLRTRIGFLPETPPLYGDMRVRDFLRHIGRLRGLGAAAVEARLPEVIRTAQLEGREDQVIDTLSHGFRKRVGIASTIVHDPRLVILDEPISGLDPEQIVEMRRVIRGLAKGRAVIVSSHILPEVQQTCDWLLVLRDGRLVAQGTEAELTSSQRRTRLALRVRGDVEALRGWLAAREGASEIEVSPAGDGLARATVTLASDDRERLAADLITAGFGLRGLEEAETALEELFLGLTRRSDVEAAA